MTIDQFWNLVDRAHTASGGDMDAKCRCLATELRQLSPEKVQSFGGHFSDYFYQAYTWELWDAAWLINGGCSDDKFMDFRSMLISLGRVPFEAVLANADSLADFNIDPGWATYKGYQYVVGDVYSEKGCQGIADGRKRPQEPTGAGCHRWEMSAKFPKLAAKYGHQDADYFDEKERMEKQARKEQLAGRLAALMLAAGIIPACGLIPPLRIVARILQTGHSPSSTGRPCTWEPCELDEAVYWLAVTRVEKYQPEDLKSRPDLQTVKLRLDVGAGEVNDFEDWIETLKQRGLA